MLDSVERDGERMCELAKEGKLIQAQATKVKAKAKLVTAFVVDPKNAVGELFFPEEKKSQ